MPNVVEFLREKTIDSLFKTATFPKYFPKWKPEICKGGLSAANIIDIGDNLRDIMFKTNPNLKAKVKRTESEGQSDTAASGHLWEGLVSWYCNLCLIGSRTVVIKKTSTVPENLTKIIEIDYDGVKSTAEVDLWAITFPDKNEFTKDIPESFSKKPTLAQLRENPNAKHRTVSISQATKQISSGLKKWLDQNVEENISDFELGIISCKTNWADDAVIPQHWDLVYTLSTEMPEALLKKNMTIGIDSSYSISDLKNFFYAFATLPSQKPENFSNVKILPIVRLKQLSGGNYWGRPTQSGVNSIKDIFEKNFSTSVGTKEQHLVKLQKHLTKLSTDYSYFEISN